MRDGAEALIQRHWYARRHPWLLPLTLPLSWGFALVAGIRRLAYRRGWLHTERLPVPVIVVGNITVGGTGKTPLVLWLAAQLRARGLVPGIVNRGYGGHGTEWPCEVAPGADAAQVGDEAVLLARRSGAIVVAGPDRVAAVRRAIVLGANVILADDGLQHYRLGRDCELVVVDGARGIGSGRLLPAGPLREPVTRLRQADAVLVRAPAEPQDATAALPAGMGGAADLPPIFPFRLAAAEVLSLGGGERRSLGQFAGQRVHAIAAIGHPQGFFATLRAAGLEVDGRPLADHAPITATDLDFGDDLPVLMTEKDAVKCAAYRDARLWVVEAHAQLQPADARQLLELIERAIVRGAVG